MVLANEITEGTRTKDIKTSQGVTFSSMLLAPETLKGLQKSGFFKPSPIQLHAIPLGKCGFGKEMSILLKNFYDISHYQTYILFSRLGTRGKIGHW